jgi:membrane associated rhomboid family serine protease
VFPISDVNPARGTPVLTILVIAVNVVVFFLLQPRDPEAAFEFGYRNAAVACELMTGEPLTAIEVRSERCLDGGGGDGALFPEKVLALSVLVSLFLHGNFVHLAGNMWFLWIFGNNIEEAFGRLGYALLYLVGGVVATAAFVLSEPASTAPLIGASGAIAAVLGAYLVLYPTRLVMSVVFVTLVPVPAAVFLGLWLLGQFAVTDPGVAWQAHVGGFVVGAAVALALRPLLARRVRRIQRRAWAD